MARFSVELSGNTPRLVDIYLVPDSGRDSRHMTDGRHLYLCRSTFNTAMLISSEVAQDILGLTKLNYNSCNAGDTQPVTVKFSDAVGEILVSNPTVTERQPTFKFYI